MDRILEICRVKAWLKELLDCQLKSYNYDTRVRELEAVVEQLNKKREEIQHKVDEEELRYGREILVDVKKWLELADELIFDYEIFTDDPYNDLAMFNLSKTGGYLPKPGIRYRQSREAYDITRRTNALLKSALTFVDTISHWSGPPSMAAFFSNIGYESYPSREETMRNVIAALEDPRVRIIGLYGLSGVGKTTLVKEVVKEASKAMTFQIAMASVTRNPDIRKIQGQIADMLGVTLNEESEIARAVRIQKRLKNEKERTLVILDDLWEKVDLSMLGISYDMDDDDVLKNLNEGKSRVHSTKESKQNRGASEDGEKTDKPQPTRVHSTKESKINRGASEYGEKTKKPLITRVHSTTESRKNRGASEYGEKTDKTLPTRVHSTTESKKNRGASEYGEKTEKILTQYKGCKILMISESRQVLSSQMEGKASVIFPVEVLTEKESEMLFKKMAGIDDNNSKFEKLVVPIANKCNGLPMLIITIARALKNQSRSVWENIHRTLEGQNLTGTPEFSTKLSYDHLEDHELRYAFLLCAHMGRDALIMDLVKYCIGLGFLQGIYTARETRSRVHSLVAKLKESGLLSDSFSRDQFTMQDIVRSAALSIAYKEKHSFTMTKGMVDEWPENLERYASISFYHCDFIEGFPRRINNPGLRVFQVINNDPKLRIPKNFFRGMKELKVLLLTGIHLSLSESSISSLKKLRMLCLEQCSMLDEELSIIGKLKKLRVLSFSGSDIKILPVELKQLEKLQIFDISNCSKLKEIPSGVISSMVHLEELYMRNTLIQWENEEPSRQSKIDLLSELKYLNQLTTLDIQIPNISYLPKNLFFDELYNYKIVVGDLTAPLETDFKMPEKYETIRFLAVSLKNGFDIHSLKGIKMLFETVENLFLELSSVHENHNNVHEERNIVHDIFYRLNLKGFPYLKHLLIVNNSSIQSLIHPKDRQHPERAFPKLESLYLYNLQNMEKICFCELSEPSFGRLKVIKINLCGQLKNVFTLSVVRLLKLLETIEVSECDSLKNIVPVESQSNTDKTELLKFPELRFLTLQSLSEFIGFYPDEAKTELMHEKVEISKLERMELYSIPIDKIWSDHPSQRSSFEKLTHLDVNGCYKLKYLLSYSVAKSLSSLQSLFVSECEKMTSIFLDSSQMEGSIFLNLKSIKLCGMKSLREIWNSKLPSDSFGKLDTLIIEKCDRLVNVFPCYKKGTFRSLCNLRVTNCRLMKAIFNMLEQIRDVSNLRDVHLELLPNLEHVWQLNENQGGINWNNLQKIWVEDCHSLQNIFPFSVAKCLENLEYLVVCKCSELREIVAEREAASTDKFDFPKLRTIKFSELQRLMSFYPGPAAYELSCPMLNDLSINLCDLLEPFSKETVDAQRKRVYFPEKVINKLKSMQIESGHAQSLRSYMGKSNHRRDNLEELCLSNLRDTEILYSFLHRNPNLKSLTLNDSQFDMMVPLEKCTEIDNLGVVPKLKTLKLINVDYLKDIGFDAHIILERIEFLILKNCFLLDHVLLSSVSLTHLTNLEVANCNGLKFLMSPSTAKSLGQLNTMKVIKCRSLVEIVGEEGENGVKVVFKQLKALELVSLRSLECFCSSDSCDFEFPSLEKLIVSACSKMEKFSEIATIPRMLKNIYVVHEKEKKTISWDGDLNATIQRIFKEKKFFEGMDETDFTDHPELQQAWEGEFDEQKSWFYSLKILKLVFCEIQPCAIPSHILVYLKSLKELEVQRCHNVEVIFDMNATEGAGLGTTFQLQKLTLKYLPKLTRVWERNGTGAYNFQKLQAVVVQHCDNLQTVFPAVVAKNLKKLDQLVIGYCEKLLEIVAREDIAAAGVTQKFVFPCLTRLDLSGLPALIYFYPQSFTLECPVLNQLFVVQCRQLDLHESANRKPLLLSLKDISSLEKLSLDWRHALVLRPELRALTGELEYLNYIKLLFDFCPIEFEQVIDILQKAPNIKEMDLECYTVSLPTKISKIDETLPHLKLLWLLNVQNLRSIWSEDSPWLNMISEKLCSLHVYDCPDLETLAHSTTAVSFSNLKELFIYSCGRLNHLFTASAAEKLKHLEYINVDDCTSIKKIVAEDETTSGGIKLERLYCISLNSLPSLECFYSGNDTLQLPSLIKAEIWDCPIMKIFSRGEIHLTYSFRGIKTPYNSNSELFFYHDLNSSVKEVSLLQFFQSVKEECFPDNLKPQIGLQDKLPSCLCDLVTLKLYSCTLPYAIPFSILSYLKKLEKLEVQYSEVQVIFDMDSTEITVTTSQNYPIFRNLKEVVVEECECLQNLFPASLAKHLEKLEKLRIQGCNELRAIVKKEEGTSENMTEKFVFPCSETLDITEITETTFQNLKEVVVMNCSNLQTLFPASLAKHLEKLEKLRIEDCHELQAIVKKEEGSSANMTKKFVFPCSETLDSTEITETTFQNLKEVVVINCSNLQTLFPASLVKNLKELEKLEIEYCHKLQAIVEMEEGTSANVTEKFVFPCLESLYLHDLPQVTYFYPQKFTLECPALNRLGVTDSHELELFQSGHPKVEGEGRGSSSNRLPLISNLKDISNLKELRLDWEQISALSLWFKSEQFMDGLNHLEKITLFFEQNERQMLPIEIILRKAPNLIEMNIGYCDSLDIFLVENPEIREDRMLRQLKILTLFKVSMLQTIELEDSSWLNTICEDLHEINVLECSRLTALTRTVSFSCLRKVFISSCLKLEYLFTSSAAKKLMKLEEITLTDCESLKEIVAEEGDGDANKGEGENKYENEIIFRKLKILTLDSLPIFESFYTGSSTLNFPSLKEVEFTDCYSTKLFHRGDKVPTELKVMIDGVATEGDINSAIVQQFVEEAA